MNHQDEQLDPDDNFIQNKNMVRSAELPPGADDFVKMPRYFRELLVDNQLSTDEYSCLTILWFDANPKNANVKITYGDLSETLGKPINTINKICLTLLQKKYIYFEKRRGSKTGRLAKIINYPLCPLKPNDATRRWTAWNAHLQAVVIVTQDNNGNVKHSLSAEFKFKKQNLSLTNDRNTEPRSSPSHSEDSSSPNTQTENQPSWDRF